MCTGKNWDWILGQQSKISDITGKKTELTEKTVNMQINSFFLCGGFWELGDAVLAGRDLSSWSLHVLLLPMWVSSGYFDFLPQSKDTYIG